MIFPKKHPGVSPGCFFIRHLPKMINFKHEADAFLYPGIYSSFIFL